MREMAEHGTWGERIPDNDRLKAFADFVANEPLFESESALTVCACCGGEHQQDREGYLRVIHDSDCPWLRAQKRKPASDL